MLPSSGPGGGFAPSRRSVLLGGLGVLAATAVPAAHAQTQSAGRQAADPRRRTFPIAAFRRTGDVDDTPAIQRAIMAAHDAGGGTALGVTGQVYRVSPMRRTSVLHPSGGRATRDVCLLLPSGVLLDLAGSVLQLTGPRQAIVLANSAVDGRSARNVDLGLMNLVIDGGRLGGEGVSLLHLANVERLALAKVTIQRGNYQGGWIYNARGSWFDELIGLDFAGQPWTIGSPLGATNQVYDSAFGRLVAKDVRKLNGQSQPGNSFDLVLSRCSISSISAARCAAGVKVQWPSVDVTIGQVDVQQCGDGSANSGLKIQGDDRGFVQRVRVQSVTATEQSGAGLFLERSRDCSVTRYVGTGNCQTGNGGDVWLGGINDRVDMLTSSMSGGNGVQVRSYARGYRVEKAMVMNPGRAASTKNRAAIGIYGGDGSFGQVACADDGGGTVRMSRGVDVVDGGASGEVRDLTCTGQAFEPYRSVSSGYRVHLHG